MELLKLLLGDAMPKFRNLTPGQWLELGIEVGMIAPEFLASPANPSRDTRLKLDDVIVKFEKRVGLL